METPAQQVESDPLSKENSAIDLEREPGQDLELEVVETSSNDSGPLEDHVCFNQLQCDAHKRIISVCCRPA